MISFRDLLRIARALAAGEVGGGSLGRPRVTDLRGAVGKTYYAMFHALALSCANMLVGASPASRDEQAWVQAYRALDHGMARNRCNRSGINRFSPAIRSFGKKFVELQAMRHRADYNPESGDEFLRAQVLDLIDEAEDAIDRFLQTPASERTAFAIYLLLPIRND